MRISDWSSDVCSSDLEPQPIAAFLPAPACQRAGARLPVGRRIETRDHAEAERRILWQILDHAGDAIILLEIAAGERQRLADRIVVAEIGRASCRERVCQSV